MTDAVKPLTVGCGPLTIPAALRITSKASLTRYVAPGKSLRLITVPAPKMTAPETETTSYALVVDCLRLMLPELVLRSPVMESVPVAAALPGASVPMFVSVPEPR